MGFAKKSKVFSIVSLGGVCTNLGFIPCGQLVAMRANQLEIGSGKTDRDLPYNLRNWFSIDGVKRFTQMYNSGNLVQIMDKLDREKDGIKSFALLVNELGKIGELCFLDIIDRIDSYGAGNLYLILCKSKDKRCVSNNFARLINNLDDVGASNFTLILGKDEEGSKYSVLDNSLINVFGVDSLVGILEKLDEQGIHNLVMLLKQKESAITKVFIRVLNSLSSAGATNFSRILNALSEQETFNFFNVLVSKNLDIDKLVEKINDEKFNTNTFVDKLFNFVKNTQAEDQLAGKGLSLFAINENYIK